MTVKHAHESRAQAEARRRAAAAQRRPSQPKPQRPEGPGHRTTPRGAETASITGTEVPSCPHCAHDLYWLTMEEWAEALNAHGMVPDPPPAGTRLLPTPHPFWFCPSCKQSGALTLQ